MPQLDEVGSDGIEEDSEGGEVSFFPFTIFSNDKGHSSIKFRPAFIHGFNLNKPNDRSSWFCYDVIFLSPEMVTFVARGMLDNFYGGRGYELFRFDSTVDKTLTEEAISSQAFYLAKLRRETELYEAEQAVIRGYADEILSSVFAEAEKI